MHIAHLYFYINNCPIDLFCFVELEFGSSYKMDIPTGKTLKIKMTTTQNDDH